MWHWQHKNEHAKIILWAKLAGISLLLHVCILGYLLMWYREHDAYHVMLHISRISRDTPVVFMPLYKRIPSSPKTTRTTLSKQEVNTIPKDTSRTTSQATAAKAPLKKATTLASPATESKNTTRKTAQEKNKKQAAPAKRLTDKSVSKIAKNEKAPAPAKKKQQKNDAKAKPTPQNNAQEAASDNKKNAEFVKQEKMSASITPASAATTVDATEIQEPVYVGQEEWYALQMHQAIEDELAQHWEVPSSLSPDLSCQIAVTVDWQGKIQQVHIAQSSGVLAYDISARSAATRMQLPALARGKEFIITFKQ